MINWISNSQKNHSHKGLINGSESRRMADSSVQQIFVSGSGHTEQFLYRWFKERNGSPYWKIHFTQKFSCSRQEKLTNHSQFNGTSWERQKEESKLLS